MSNEKLSYVERYYVALDSLATALASDQKQHLEDALASFDDLAEFSDKLHNLDTIRQNHSLFLDFWEQVYEAVKNNDESALENIEARLPAKGARIFEKALKKAKETIKKSPEQEEFPQEQVDNLELPDPLTLDKAVWAERLVKIRRYIEEQIALGFPNSSRADLLQLVAAVIGSISDAETAYFTDLGVITKIYDNLKVKLSEDEDEKSDFEKELDDLEEEIFNLSQRLLITDPDDADYFDPSQPYRGGLDALDFLESKKSYFNAVLAPDLDKTLHGRKQKVDILTKLTTLQTALDARVTDIAKRISNEHIASERTPAFTHLESLVKITITGTTNYDTKIVELADAILDAENDYTSLVTEAAKKHYQAIINSAKEIVKKLNTSTTEYYIKRITIPDASNPNSESRFVAIYDDLAKAISTDATLLKNQINLLQSNWDAVWDKEARRILVPLPVLTDRNSNTVYPTTEMEDKYHKCGEIVTLRKKVEKKLNELQSRYDVLTRNHRAKEIIEQKWAAILKSDATTKTQTQNDARVNNPYNGNIENAGIKALVKHFFPSESRVWEIKIDLWNAFAKAANTDIFKQMGWINTYEARNNWAGELDLDIMKEFVNIPEIKPAFEYMEDIFALPQTYVGTKGEVVTHDYAKDGNPNAGEVEKGVKTVAELIKEKFPDLDSSNVDGLMFIALTGELRLKYHARYHGAYMKSADGTFDTKPIFLHAPLDAITYKIRAYGKVFPNHRLIWQILRMPNSGIYKLTFKNALKSAISRGEEHDYMVELFDEFKIDEKQLPGFGDEFLPEDVPNGDKSNPLYWDKAYNNHQVAEAAIFRAFDDRQLTSSWEDFTPVRVGEDKSLIPFWWDVAFHSEEHGFRAITHKEFFDTCQNWLKFLDKAQNPAPITKMSDVNDRISDLVATLSPAKAFLGMMPAGTPHGDRLRAFLCQVFLRFTKNIYDQYDAKASFGIKDRLKAPTKRTYFYKVVKSEYQKLGTLDKSVKKFMIEHLDKNFSLTGSITDNLFVRASGNPMPLNPFKRTKVEELIEQYLKEPTEEEKKQ